MPICKHRVKLPSGPSQPSGDRLLGAAVALAYGGGRFSIQEPSNEDIAQAWRQRREGAVDVDCELRLAFGVQRARIGEHVKEGSTFAIVGPGGGVDRVKVPCRQAPAALR